jgi:predicted MPP superfamily phosphohydrolase
MRYLFILPPTLFIVSVHAYLWLRLVRDPQWPVWARRSATWLLIALAAMFPATFVVWFRVHSAHPLHFAVAFGWLGAIGYATAVLAAWDGVRILRWFSRRLPRRSRSEVRAPLTAAESLPAAASARLAGQSTPGAEPARVCETRRVFVARTVAGSALVAAGGVSIFGVRAALWDITTPEVSIGLPRLPRQLDGYTIALLTDIHIGPVLDARFLRHLVEKTNQMKPDAVALGGDLVDGRVIEIGERAVAELRNLRARDGVFMVTGNHEYYWGAGAWIDFHRSLGTRVLMNERVALGDASPGGAQFDLAGVPDHRAGERHAIGADVFAATAGRDEQRELVMLAHQPIQIGASVEVGAGLQLSGHTHGGQLNPFGAVAAMQHQPYLAGLHRHPGTNTQIYVSRGTGFWGPPMRVLAPAEITRIRLYRA